MSVYLASPARRWSRQFSLAALTSVGFILAGCSQGAMETPAELAKEAVAQVDGIPHAQLPDTVVPQNYTIDMRMDPDADGFSGRVDLTFTELSADEAPSGIAHLTSEETLPKGLMTLKMDYETPYNQSLNSAYQVKRDGEGYIITQFEPLGARLISFMRTRPKSK